MQTPIKYLDLHPRAKNVLRAAEFEIVANLITEGKKLLKLRNFRKESFKKLEELLESKGLQFSKNIYSAIKKDEQ